ncbi:MAG TPA: adenylate/guanylate cyclase domain-containing protein [Gemmataceae bacterium]|nr:adenylate/guanylate cyclase domain-containing protein [Gemmataceae bacterium]
MTPHPSRTGQTTASVSRPETPRSRRALLAHTHQSLIAPVHTLIELAGIMLVDARERGQEEFRADLEKIHTAGRVLLTRFHDLLDPEQLADAETNTLFMLQHELRTPLTHILGYCELWLEDAETFFLEGFVEDLHELHELGQRMLTHLDEIVRLLEYRGEGSLGREKTPAHPARRPPNATDKRGETGAILIVDDDDYNRDLLSRLLRREGHTVACATNAREAMTRIASQLFDLILLDVRMPDSDGVQTLAAIKADERYRHLPVIMISACEEMDIAVRCIEMGAEDYLPKPFNPVLLKARVSAGLEKKRLRDREVLFLQQIRQEQKRSDELLHVIFPDEIVRELKTTSFVRPRRFDNVAVLFCDIADFTPFCDGHEPEEVVRHLQELVELWEGIAVRHHVEKIKTIGDAFMAAAGLLETPRDHPVLHCVRCGLELIEASRQLPIPWDVRVGIHLGPVVAGVIGCRHYLFDLWGDTVNTAARMESHGIPGAVMLSRPAWAAVADRCHGEPLGRIDIKGKGPMELIRVDRLRG